MNDIKRTKALPSVSTKLIILDLLLIIVKLEWMALITKDIRSNIIYLDKMHLDSYLSKEMKVYLFGLSIMDIMAVINVSLEKNFIKLIQIKPNVYSTIKKFYLQD